MSHLKFFQWNVRGIYTPKSRKLLSKVLKKHKPDVVLLSELKVSSFQKITNSQQRIWFPGYILYCNNCRCGILIKNELTKNVRKINIPYIKDNAPSQQMVDTFHHCAIKIKDLTGELIIVSGYRSPSTKECNVTDIFKSYGQEYKNRHPHYNWSRL